MNLWVKFNFEVRNKLGKLRMPSLYFLVISTEFLLLLFPTIC